MSKPDIIFILNHIRDTAVQSQYRGNAVERIIQEIDEYIERLENEAKL